MIERITTLLPSRNPRALWLALLALFAASSTAFRPTVPSHGSRCSTTSALAANTNRRQWLQAGLISAASIATNSGSCYAVEIDEPLREFVDPQGLFTITVPKRFFAIRRTAQGDLPDSKTGSGRRGSSIFSAGNMAKAEVVAIERFPTSVLLEENGISATGKLDTIREIGDPATVANLIQLRRDRDKPGATNTVLDKQSVTVSGDGLDVSFSLKTKIDVQKPELLMETMGVSELYRVTSCKASLKSQDGNIMAVFASALESDYNGPDGRLLQTAVDSFQALPHN